MVILRLMHTCMAAHRYAISDEIHQGSVAGRHEFAVDPARARGHGSPKLTG